MARDVSSKIRINRLAIKRLETAQIRALRKTADFLHGEIADAQVIPMETGALSGEQFFVQDNKASEGHAELVNATPYARRLYFHPEYNFSKTYHADAQGEWFDPWVDGSKKNVAENAYRRFYKEESGV